MYLRKYFIFFIMIFCWLSCKQKPKQHIPQRIYSPIQSYSQGDFYITNDLYYADGFMETSIGGELDILRTISEELQKHPEIRINIIPPWEGPNAPAFSYSISGERAMTLKAMITENLDDPERVKWELDSIPQYIISDGDYHKLTSTIFIIEKRRVR